MPNGTYGGVRGKETKVGQKTFVSRPTRFRNRTHPPQELYRLSRDTGSFFWHSDFFFAEKSFASCGGKALGWRSLLNHEELRRDANPLVNLLDLDNSCVELLARIHQPRDD